MSDEWVRIDREDRSTWPPYMATVLAHQVNSHMVYNDETGEEARLWVTPWTVVATFQGLLPPGSGLAGIWDVSFPVWWKPLGDLPIYDQATQDLLAQ